jgi:uncharacterized protein (DUF58 family)
VTRPAGRTGPHFAAEARLEDVDTLDARRFVIAIRRLADSLGYGTDRSRYLGSGIDYVQSRPYSPGDSVRAIDWRVTARTQRYHVKDYESPRRIPVYLVVDTSASMTVSSTRRSKYALALHVAGGLALACLERVSPVGVIGAGDREFRVEPSLSRDRVLQWVLELRSYRFDEGTALGHRLVELRQSLTQRSLLLVLSDLHDPSGVQALKLFGQEQDVIALQLQDPAELGLGRVGYLRGQEAETGRTFVTTGRQAWVDPALVERELRKAGVDHMVLRTDLPFVARLRHFLSSRGVLSGGAR